MTKFAIAYAAARRAEDNSVEKVNALLIANYPVKGDKDARKAFERTEMAPFEMARLLAQAGRDNPEKIVKAFFAVEKFSVEATHSSPDMKLAYRCYKSANTLIGRILERAGLRAKAGAGDGAQTGRADKGKGKGKGKGGSAPTKGKSAPTETTAATVAGDLARLAAENAKVMRDNLARWASLLTEAGLYDAADAYADMLDKAEFILGEAIKEAKK